MLSDDDKCGRVDRPAWLLSGFRDVISGCGPTNIVLEGYPYTWAKSKGKENAVEERLDQAMATEAWLSLFLETRLNNLFEAIFDHSPILLTTKVSTLLHFVRKFRFENTWFNEPDLEDIVVLGWNKVAGDDIIVKLDSCTHELNKWGKHLRTRIREEIDKCKSRIDEVRGCDDENSANEFNFLRVRLTDLLVQEETFCRQRAKAYWLKDGDQNTKYFHAHASARKKINKIQHLEHDEHVLVEDHAGMCSIATKYFDDLFEASIGQYELVLDTVSPCVTYEDNFSLMVPFSKAEFLVALS